MVFKYKCKDPSITPKEKIHEIMRGMKITNKENETRNKEKSLFYKSYWSEWRIPISLIQPIKVKIRRIVNIPK